MKKLIKTGIYAAAILAIGVASAQHLVRTYTLSTTADKNGSVSQQGNISNLVYSNGITLVPMDSNVKVGQRSLSLRSSTRYSVSVTPDKVEEMKVYPNSPNTWEAKLADDITFSNINGTLQVTCFNCRVNGHDILISIGS